MRARTAIETAEGPLLVADMSLLEIATAVGRGRMRFRVPLRDWLERATSPPLVRLCRITPAVAAELVHLPSDFPKDPADRIIVATARVLGATLATMDTTIIRSRAVPTLS